MQEHIRKRLQGPPEETTGLDFLCEEGGIRIPGQSGSREKVEALKQRLEGLSAGTETAESLAADVEMLLDGLLDAENLCRTYSEQEPEKAQFFLQSAEAYGQAADSLEDLLELLQAGQFASVWMPWAAFESAVSEVDRLLDESEPTD